MRRVMGMQICVGAVVAALCCGASFVVTDAEGSCNSQECIQTDCVLLDGTATDNAYQYDLTSARFLYHNTSQGNGWDTMTPVTKLKGRIATGSSNYCAAGTSYGQVGNSCSSNRNWTNDVGNQRICCNQGSGSTCKPLSQF